MVVVVGRRLVGMRQPIERSNMVNLNTSQV